MATNGNTNAPRSANGYLLVVIVGFLGADPEMRYSASGVAVTNLRIATNLNCRQNGQNVVGTMWARITVLGKQGESCNQYLKKGRQVLIQSGSLEFDPATGGPKIFTRKNGVPGASFEFTADTVRFLGSGGDHGDIELTDVQVTVGTGEEEVIDFAA